jgi:hypothetical protein
MQHCIRRFSVLKFGEEKAKQLAMQARKEGLNAMKAHKIK